MKTGQISGSFTDVRLTCFLHLGFVVCFPRKTGGSLHPYIFVGGKAGCTNERS
jgi:hypothetical protein